MMTTIAILIVWPIAGLVLGYIFGCWARKRDAERSENHGSPGDEA
jgi:hypothetical protein